MKGSVFKYVQQITADFWVTLLEMSPYLLFGFFMAGLLSILVSRKLVERHLGGRGIWPLVKASIFGVPLPLCSCGVIPVSMSLHKQGASKGSTISFLLSTPQTGMDSIFVTFSLLGPVFAVFRPIAAFITGVVGGALVDLFGDSREIPAPQIQNGIEEDQNNQRLRKRIINGLRYGFVILPRDIGRAILVGLIIAAAITALVPEGFFADKIGTGFLSKVVMLFLGIPVYVCATASVPVAAALIIKGITPGAALVFLMTGPATNAASFITIWKTLGARTAIIYMLSVAGCALIGGVLLDYIFTTADFEVVSTMGHMLPAAIRYVSATVLLTILAVAIVTEKTAPLNS